MGASGDLGILDLTKHSFSEIKQRLINKISENENAVTDKHSKMVYQNAFFAVCEMNTINDLMNYFQTAIHYWCPSDSKICINGKMFKDWANEQVPIIIENHLVLYSTDQQDIFGNMLFNCLYEIITDIQEIWT